MQNPLQTNFNYDQNIWYNNMFATEIKTEPGTSPTPTTPPSHLEQYLKHQQQHQHLNSAMNTSAIMTPSPNNDNGMQHFFDATMQQKIYQQQQLQYHQQHQQQYQQQQQQQQYQQQFQYAQQAAAQNHMSAAVPTAHLALAFNPLTPPELPTVATLSQTYCNSKIRCKSIKNSNKTCDRQHKTPSPTNCTTQLTPKTSIEMNACEALTPSNTPPMELNSPKDTAAHSHSPRTCCSDDENESDKEQEDMSHSSDDYVNFANNTKYMESIFNSKINSHGKLILHNCKTCHQKFDTKAKLWVHVEGHIKPEKVLRCPYTGCPFVTDLKHFLQFHLSKHRKEKPYKCTEPGCTYRCETKGMLTSHLKSHSKVFRYHCADCDYAVKFLHSFKLHLKKHNHRQGNIFDEDGNLMLGIIIDVHGKRRGPKNKKVKRNTATAKIKAHTSQLSAALQGIKMTQQNNQQQQEEIKQPQQLEQPEQSPTISSENSTNLTINEMPTPKHQRNNPTNLILNNFQQQPQDFSNLLTPTLVKAFLPYLNFQMYAAQQQLFAQLSPGKRENFLQQLQNQYEQQQRLQQQHQDVTQQQNQEQKQTTESKQQLFQNFVTVADTDNEEEDEKNRRSVDSAMDLSQPANGERQTPENDEVINLKMKQKNDAAETPVGSVVSKRKGRILQLDELLEAQKLTQQEIAQAQNNIVAAATVDKLTERTNSEESLQHVAGNSNGNGNGNGNTTTSSSTSNDSGTATSNESSDSEPASTTDVKQTAAKLNECKHCDIIFKDPVLYYIHMGYHSCDDAFKCNMCGEKCDGPVGLFMHMARNPHD